MCPSSTHNGSLVLCPSPAFFFTIYVPDWLSPEVPLAFGGHGHLAEVRLRFAGPGDALLVSHAPVLRDDWPARKSPNASGPNATPTLGAPRERVPQIDPLLNQAAQALRVFQL